MNSRSAAITGLRRLVLGLDQDNDDLSVLLAELVRSLTVAVPSFGGLRLVLEADGRPVVLTTLDDEEREAVVTSLRWWLGPGGQLSTAHLTLYASRPGALVDLAADLDYTARQGSGSAAQEAPAEFGVRLDRDLPPPAGPGGLDGLHELSVLNRAVGILLDQGVVPEDALTELARRAAGTRRGVLGQARYLVDGIVPD